MKKEKGSWKKRIAVGVIAVAVSVLALIACVCVYELNIPDQMKGWAIIGIITVYAVAIMALSFEHQDK